MWNECWRSLRRRLHLGIGMATCARAAPSENPISAQAAWYHDSWWDTEVACNNAGRQLVDSGIVQAWTCLPEFDSAPNPDRPWDLRILD
jgi:hypothetical protein